MAFCASRDFDAGLRIAERAQIEHRLRQPQAGVIQVERPDQLRNARRLEPESSEIDLLASGRERSGDVGQQAAHRAPVRALGRLHALLFQQHAQVVLEAALHGVPKRQGQRLRGPLAARHTSWNTAGSPEVWARAGDAIASNSARTRAT